MRTRLLSLLLLVPLAGLLGWWLLADLGGPGDAGPGEESGIERSSAPPGPEARDVSLEGRRAPVGRDGEEAEPPPPHAAGPAEAAARETLPLRHVRGRAVDAGRQPIPDTVAWIDLDVAPPFPVGYADAHGLFAIPLRSTVPAGTHRVAVRAADGRAAFLRIGVDDTGIDIDPGDVDLGDVVLLERGVIRGRVTDSRGRGLARHRVLGWAEEGLVLETLRGGRRLQIGRDDVLTDEEGAFVLRGLTPVPHRLRVDLDFQQGKRVEPGRMDGQRPDGPPVVFVVRSRRVLHGRLVDAGTGAVIEHILLWSGPLGGGGGEAPGTFEVEAPVDDETVVIKALGYLPLELDAASHAAAADDARDAAGDIVDLGDLPLERDPQVGSLRIAARDAEGQEATGWSAEIEDSGFCFWALDAGATNTLVIEGLKPGRHEVQVGGEGWSLTFERVDIEVGEQTDLAVTLYRAGAVLLEVVDEEGACLGRAQVSLFDARGRPVKARWTVEERPHGTLLFTEEQILEGGDEIGRCRGRLDGLPPGLYTLQIRRGPRVDEVTIEVPACGEAKRTIRLGDAAEEASRGTNDHAK